MITILFQGMAAESDPTGGFPSNPFDSGDGGKIGAPGEERRFIDGPKIPLSEIFSLVRHSKLSLIKQALDYLPNKAYDKTLTQVGCRSLAIFFSGYAHFHHICRNFQLTY